MRVVLTWPADAQRSPDLLLQPEAPEFRRDAAGMNQLLAVIAIPNGNQLPQRLAKPGPVQA
jgi:hypothetical protein